MDTSVVTLLGLIAFGLVIGPWLGIAVDRAVDRIPLFPEHRCATCATGLGVRSLIPMVGWWDRCGACGCHKGRRYPLVDVATALVFGALGLRFDLGWYLAAYLALGAVLVVLSAIDVETHLLPNIITWPAFWGGLFVILVLSGHQDDAEGVRSAIVGAAVFTGFIGAAHLAYERGMGRGDVKLSMTLGLFLGWPQAGLIDTTRLVLLAILVAFAGGGLIGLAYNRIRSRGRAEIPFGPALAGATLVMVMASPRIMSTVSF